jgi:hypothetical protein
VFVVRVGFSGDLAFPFSPLVLVAVGGKILASLTVLPISSFQVIVGVRHLDELA